MFVCVCVCVRERECVYPAERLGAKSNESEFVPCTRAGYVTGTAGGPGLLRMLRRTRPL